MKNKITALVLAFFLSGFNTMAQETWSRVRIYFDAHHSARSLSDAGLLPEHFSKGARNSIDAEIDSGDIQKLKNAGVRYEVLVPDIKAAYLESLQGMHNQKSGAPACGLANFDYGTMGPYHTFTEVVAHLDAMQAAFPNLVTTKDSLGASIEGRAIWAVKISDNPNTNESATEAPAYYDALHHAREPHSMESLLYFMWWLLENYGTDPVASYLVDNRELFFVPVVNPDGYVYNQTTDPNGGGMWRKNRRDNGGGVYGVDLNRNYSSSWGDPVGSSGNPTSGTYRGDSAFSEPESRAVRDYVIQIDPAVAFCCHTHGQKYLVSPGCMYPLDNYETYAEFSSEFILNDWWGYGTTSLMLGYSSCGTTRHFMHDRGTIAWTPEIGDSFWPAQSAFCSTVEGAQPSLLYIAHVAGSYARLHDFSVTGPALPGDTLAVDIRVRNRGLRMSADSVSVTATILTGNATALNAVTALGNIPARGLATGSMQFLVNPAAMLNDSVTLEFTVMEKGYITHVITKNVWVGTPLLIFQDNAESGFSNWTSASWDTTFMDRQSGLYCFADSRYGNYESNDTRIIQLVPQLKLAGATTPVLEMNAKWSLEPTYDDLVMQVSLNGTSWNTLRTYDGHSHWTQDRTDLSAYAGQNVYLRFLLDSDNGVQSDGFYFDDLRVVQYQLSGTGIDDSGWPSTVSLFPSPASETLQVRAAGKAQYEIITATGMRAGTGHFTDATSIDLRPFAAGVYVLRVFGIHGSHASRFVIERP